MVNHSFILKPIVVRNNTMKRVPNYKLIGVIIISELKWTCLL